MVDEFVPRQCPSCNSDLEWRGVDVICTNKYCFSRSIKNTEYFLRTLGAENITSTTLENLGVYDIEDAYQLDEWNIADTEGFGIRSGELIVKEIKKTLKTTECKLLQAFGIPGVGKEISKALLECFGSIENVFYVTVSELQGCEGVGPKIAENISKSVSRCEDYYKYMLNMGMKFVDKKGGDNMMNGKQFALTGKGPMSRKDLTDLIEESDGIVKGISKSTDYLVTDDANSQSGKMKKAKQYNIYIISYDELLEALEG